MIGWLLILGSALLMVVRMVWAAEPYSAWYTDAAGNEVIEDGFFYRPLGGTLSLNIALGMLVVGVGLCGFAVSRRYRWVGGPLAIALTWCLWAAMAIATSTLLHSLKLNPDVWGWWATFSDMHYEGAVALGVMLALTGFTASFAAIQLIRASVVLLERWRNRAERNPVSR